MPASVGVRPDDGRATGGRRLRPALALRLLAVLAVLGVQAAAAHRRLRLPAGLYDEGIYLSAARFVADGRQPYVDFLHPYGPGLAYLDAALIAVGLDQQLAHRLLWELLRLALSVVVVLLAWRRGVRWPVVLGLAALLQAPVGVPYLVPLLLLALTVLWLDRRPERSHLCLLVLAPAAWFRWEHLAVWGLVALLVVLRAGRGPQRRAAGVTAVAAGAVAVAPYLLLVAAGGAGGLRQTVEAALTTYPEYRSIDYPWRAPRRSLELALAGRFEVAATRAVLGAAFVALPLVVAATGVLTALRWRRTGTAPEHALVVVLATGAVLLWGLRVRPDIDHAGPAVLVFALLVATSSAGRPTVLRRAVLPALAGACVAVLTSTALLTARDGGPAGEGLERRSGRFSGVPLDPEVAAAVTAAERLVGPDGRPLFVANTDNRIAFVNAPWFYWALAAEPASEVTHYDPGYADQAPVQRRVIDDLCRTAAVVLTWQAPVGQEVAGLAFSDELDVFLARRYEVRDTHGAFALLVPTFPAGGCPASSAPAG